jgi:16S rRNA G527 N7-methylase RsmG
VSNLGLTASVLSSRFEELDWDNRAETADIVTIRAVKLSRELSESTSMALKSTGRLLLFHSPSSTIAGNPHLRLVDDFPLGKLGSRLAILEKK